jgi:hypothetical protein
VPANHVPEASVIRGAQALSGFIGRKEKRRCLEKFYVKAQGSTLESRKKLSRLSQVEKRRIPSGAVKCVDIRRNTNGEGISLDLY